jgi:ATP-dependent protease ClpP protease subunit
MGSILLGAGAKGFRKALPNSTIMIHRESVAPFVSGQLGNRIRKTFWLTIDIDMGTNKMWYGHQSLPEDRVAKHLIWPFEPTKSCA